MTSHVCVQTTHVVLPPPNCHVGLGPGRRPLCHCKFRQNFLNGSALQRVTSFCLLALYFFCILYNKLENRSACDLHISYCVFRNNTDKRLTLITDTCSVNTPTVAITFKRFTYVRRQFYFDSPSCFIDCCFRVCVV